MANIGLNIKKVEIVSAPVSGSIRIDAGSAVTSTVNGSVETGVTTTGRNFVGFACEEADNRDGVTGDLNVTLYGAGSTVSFPVVESTPGLGAQVWLASPTTVTTVKGHVPVGVIKEADSDKSGNYFIYVNGDVSSSFA